MVAVELSSYLMKQMTHQNVFVTKDQNQHRGIPPFLLPRPKGFDGCKSVHDKKERNWQKKGHKALQTNTEE